MKKDIKKLSDFYLLNEKLLYISKDFIGYDPLISNGLSFDHTRGKNEAKRGLFIVGEYSFGVIFTYSISYGPLRGFRRVEITREEKTIISHEYGSMGHGSNYSKGSSFCLDGKDAFLVARGSTMGDGRDDKIYLNLNGNDYHLFWFKNVVIPTKHKISTEEGIATIHNKSYSREEIEPLKQIIWSTDVTLNNHLLRIRKVAVPNCWRIYSDSEGNEKFLGINQEGFFSLDEIEFEWIQ
jgi:hypothetical protein